MIGRRRSRAHSLGDASTFIVVLAIAAVAAAVVVVAAAVVVVAAKARVTIAVAGRTTN